MRPLYYGRAPGIKGWLRENVPALALRYTGVLDGADQEVLAGTERTEQKRDYCAEN